MLKLYRAEELSATNRNARLAH